MTSIAAARARLALAASVLILSACGPGPATDDPLPDGDVTVTITVVGDGRAVLADLGVTCSDACTFGVDAGTEIAIMATPDAGRVLVAWDGPCDPFDDTCTWTAAGDRDVTVTFAPHALRFDLTGDGEGYFAIDAAGDVTECREPCGVPVPQPLQVTITYFADGTAGTTLEPWTGTCVDETSTYCLVDVAGVTTIGTTWRHPPTAAQHDYSTNQGAAPLEVEAPGVLAGVQDTPGDTHTASTLTGPDHGALTLSSDGAFTYEPDAGFAGVDTFTYRATDAFGNTDDAWVTVTVRPRLTLATSGGGSVSSDPPGIACGPECTSDDANFDLGSPVTLTANAGPGTTFTGWTGDACDGSTAPTCAVTMDGPKDVAAAFGVSTHVLNVGAAGDGAGNVTSDPPGIDLDAGSGSADFDHGTEVTLTASAAADSEFDRWTGVACEGGSTDDECTFTVTGAMDVTAVFDLRTHLVGVTPEGDGAGNVTSDPPGIDLADGRTSAAFTHGQSVTLTATSAAGSAFRGWSGVACDGGSTDDECTFTVTGTTDVTVGFGLEEYELEVTTAGSGLGSVVSDPPGIDVPGGQGSGTFAYGTVTLTATAGPVSAFAGWDGVACQGGNADPVCTFVHDQPRSVEATFVFTLR